MTPNKKTAGMKSPAAAEDPRTARTVRPKPKGGQPPRASASTDTPSQKVKSIVNKETDTDTPTAKKTETKREETKASVAKPAAKAPAKKSEAKPVGKVATASKPTAAPKKTDAANTDKAATPKTKPAKATTPTGAAAKPKPATPKSKKSASRPATAAEKGKPASKDKSDPKDKSELLRRLLDLRSGYQRASDREEAPKAKKTAAAVAKPETEPPTPPKPAPKKAKIRKRDLDKVIKALETERENILHDLEVLTDISNPKGEGGGQETNAFSIHLAEHATDNTSLETNLMQRHLIEERLAQVIDALERVKEGSFGVCETCSGTITLERLVAKPFARLCIECRRAMESRRNRGGV